MKNYFRRLPVKLRKNLDLVAQVSGEMGIPAYWVGGGLRDLILGVKNFDLDIAVNGDGILFAQALAKKLRSSLIIHERFRTATLILPDHLKVDIATLRRERYPYPGALPLVNPGTLEEDLKRRDFTINAMALSLTPGENRKIIDPFGAQADLTSGKIRILHDLSFQDDPTRIFRAVRFSQRFGFRIEPKTLRLIKESIAQGCLNKVNPHRLREELILVLKEQRPWKLIEQLSALGALVFINHQPKRVKLISGLFKAAAKKINEFTVSFPGRRSLDIWLVYFALLLSPLTLVQIKTLLHKLGLRKGEEKRIMSYYQLRNRLILSLSKSGVAPERVFALLNPLSYETMILLSVAARNKNFKKYLTDFLEVYNGIRLSITGDDLGSLGVLPGPVYQRIFAKVLAAKLNGRVKNRQAELALIKKLA